MLQHDRAKCGCDSKYATYDCGDDLSVHCNLKGGIHRGMTALILSTTETPCYRCYALFITHHARSPSLRRFARATAGSHAGWAQFRHGLIRDFEICASKNLNELRAGDATSASGRPSSRDRKGHFQALVGGRRIPTNGPLLPRPRHHGFLGRMLTSVCFSGRILLPISSGEPHDGRSMTGQ